MRSWTRRLLRMPRVYDLAQRAISPTSKKRIFFDEYLQAGADDRVLDVGCGPGYLLRFLEAGEYVGFDPNPAYIESARQDFGHLGTFALAGIDNFTDDTDFDIVVARGVLHHLDDDQVRGVAHLATQVLRPNGRLVCLDPCFRDGQHPIARFLVGRDRGEHVRTLSQYLELVQPYFPDAQVAYRSDLMRVPYSHSILTASAASN